MKTYLHGSMDFAETMVSCSFRVEDLNLPQRRKKYTSGRREEGVDAHMCSCGEAIERRTHSMGECEMYTEGRDVLEEDNMRKIGERDLEGFATLDSREKTIAILGD